jgi:hypothetical protein
VEVRGEEGGLGGGRCEVYQCRSARQAKHPPDTPGCPPRHITPPYLRSYIFTSHNNSRNHQQAKIKKKGRPGHSLYNAASVQYASQGSPRTASSRRSLSTPRRHMPFPSYTRDNPHHEADRCIDLRLRFDIILAVTKALVSIRAGAFPREASQSDLTFHLDF